MAYKGAMLTAHRTFRTNFRSMSDVLSEGMEPTAVTAVSVGLIDPVRREPRKGQQFDPAYLHHRKALEP